MHNATIERLSLPEGVRLSDDDREMLEAVAQAMAGLHHGSGRPWTDIARQLEQNGWDVGCHLGWVAEARRRGVREQAVGSTRDEAFAQLKDLTLLDEVEGCP